MTKEDARLLKRSFSRCFIGGRNVIDRFYDLFLSAHPEIAGKFQHTDFVQQKLLLRQGINCILMFAEGAYAGDFCLEEIKVSHNKKHHNIHPSLYVFWKESLLKALSENDPEYNPELEQLWIDAIDYGTKFITSGY